MICSLYTVVAWLLNAYVLVMLVYALVSWVPSLRGRWTDYVAMLVEPVLAPVRRIIPPLGGLDLSEHYPELGSALLVCATETKTSADIESYVAALGEVMQSARAA